MTKPMVRIHNADTNEVVDREMTDQEFKQYEADQVIVAAYAVESETKVAARQAILERLGITAEEAQLIIGGSN
jgi:hypothetical protein